MSAYRCSEVEVVAMTERKWGLGRGLAALLPNADRGLQQLPISDIAPNPQQPRRSIGEERLAELAESIREHGVIQPIVVSPLVPPLSTGQHYRLVVGERRLRAAALAGLDSVPALVRDVNSRDSLEIALVENLQRQDLNPIEEAQAYQELMASFSLTQEEVAQRVGKSRSAIANSLRLLKLPSHILDMVRDGLLSEGHARALLALPDEALITRLAQEVVARGLSVRQTEAMAGKLLLETEQRSEQQQLPRKTADPLTAAIEEQLRTRLGTKVNLQRGKRGGRLVIHFYSDEELDAIYRAILGNV